VLDVQASALENSVLYANQRGKVVWLDPDSGNVLAAYITPKMKPERVAEIRESARALSPSSGEVFDYYWPAGGFPSPEFHRWNVGQAPDAVPEGYVPPRATEATRTPQGEIDDELARMREADDAELQRAREYYAQFGITGDKPPGFVQRPDGRVVRSRFGADPDEPDPNDLFNDAGAFDNTDEVPLGDMDAAPDAPAPVASPADGAWDSVDTLLDADGNPLSPEAAAAEDWGREVVRILSDPASTPEDLEKARQIHEALKRGFDNLPDAQRQAEFKRDVLDPIEQQLGPPEDDPDALTPIDEESSDFVVPLDDVEDNLNAAATPVGRTPQPQPQPTPAPGPTPQPQPQPQPQPTPSPQPAPGPTPNPGATPGATPAPNPTPSPGATPGAAPGGTPNPTPNAGAAPGGTPTPQPAPTRTMSQRAYDHFARNYGKYGIGIPLAGVGLSLYQSMRNSDPFPNALDPLMPEDGEGMSVGGGMAAEAGMPGSGAGMKSMTPEQRIRAIIRAKELEAADESRHAPQTIWRHF
jgi:outer membrane biosynthesis protein TonB